MRFWEARSLSSASAIRPSALAAARYALDSAGVGTWGRGWLGALEPLGFEVFLGEDFFGAFGFGEDFFAVFLGAGEDFLEAAFLGEEEGFFAVFFTAFLLLFFAVFFIALPLRNRDDEKDHTGAEGRQEYFSSKFNHIQDVSDFHRFSVDGKRVRGEEREVRGP